LFSRINDDPRRSNPIGGEEEQRKEADQGRLVD